MVAQHDGEDIVVRAARGRGEACEEVVAFEHVVRVHVNEVEGWFVRFDPGFGGVERGDFGVSVCSLRVRRNRRWGR